MFERIDIVEQMCEYGLQLLEHLFEGVVMRSKSIVQVQAKTVSERYRNSFLRAHHRGGDYIGLFRAVLCDCWRA